MNIHKLQKKLKKINLLFENIQSENEYSVIEKDLLLSYLREAYEYALDDSKIIDSSDSINTSSKQDHKKTAPKEKEESSTMMMKNIVAKEMKTETTSSKLEKSIPVEIQNKLENEELSELELVFEKKYGKDLSDKLRLSPINDLTKAIGINEKIFTIKELFGGDTSLYDTVIQRINNFATYEEAKMYLISGIAKDQNWSDKEKLTKVEQFIMFVRRKFVNQE